MASIADLVQTRNVRVPLSKKLKENNVEFPEATFVIPGLKASPTIQGFHSQVVEKLGEMVTALEGHMSGLEEKLKVAKEGKYADRFDFATLPEASAVISALSEQLDIPKILEHAYAAAAKEAYLSANPEVAAAIKSIAPTAAVAGKDEGGLSAF